MAYENTRMIARRAPSDLSGVWDKLWSGLENGAKSALNFYNQAQQNKGAAAAQAPVYAPVQQSGMSSTEKLMIGTGAAILLVALLRRKS